MSTNGNESNGNDVSDLKNHIVKANGTATSNLEVSFLNHDDFRRRGCEMVRYVADYLENTGERKVFPMVSPGYLAPMIPKQPPEYPEPWEDIMEDVERVVMPGITHWQHPHFHAYFPVGNSYPSICADILTDGLSCIGFTWAASPACTELEVVMMDWFAQMLKLPEFFLSGGDGGGVIQGSCSDATLVSLFAARNRSIKAYQMSNPGATPFDAASKLVGYYSDQCTATLGTTGCCAFDHLEDIGRVCQKYDVWLHVDAAYAGSSFICPEYRPLLNGIEYAMSFVFNPHKWLLINFDCSCVWYKNVNWIIESFNVDPAYLKHKHQNIVPDFRHWHIPLGRKFRSLKIWFVLRHYGVEALRNYIRNHISLAHHFESLMRADERFEIVNQVRMGLVCFRIKKNNELTKELYQNIENDGRIHLVPSEFSHPEPIYFIRFAVCYHSANREQIEFAFHVITELATQLLSTSGSSKENTCRIEL